MKYFINGQDRAPIFKRREMTMLSFLSKMIKLIAGFVLLFTLGAYSITDAQQVSLKVHNVNLKDVISQIKKQTGYNFLFDEDLISKLPSVSINTYNKDIRYVLKDLSSKLPIMFKIKDEHIIVLGRKNNINTVFNQTEVEIKGTVRDSSGNPIQGVSIAIKDSRKNAIATDANGRFIITVKKDEVLIFSFVGYLTQEFKVEKDQDLNVVMRPDEHGLEEVVVVGFAKQKKESMVSAVSTVKGSELRMPNRSLSNNLSGQIPGLIAIQRRGEPGFDNAEFWIRGQSSFTGGTSPLILVDGIPRNMNDIEPDEIETFTLLKDAAATAIYGAEGANGVVLITSKRGIVQKTAISYRGEYSISNPTRLPSFLGSVDYLSLYNEALKNEGRAPAFDQDLIDKYATGIDRDLYPSVNWMDLLRDQTHNTRHTLNFRGGGDRMRFFVSGAYYSENGIFKQNENSKFDYNNNIGVKRYNLRSNIDLNVTKSTLLSVDLSGQYLQRNHPGYNSDDLFTRFTFTPPYLFPMIYSDGTIAGHPRASNNRVNPYNLLMESGYGRQWTSGIQSRIDLVQDLDVLTKGLKIKGTVSYDANSVFAMTRYRSPAESIATGRDDTGKLIFSTISNGSPNFGEPIETNTGDKNIYLEGSLSYARKFSDKHDVTGMLLYYQKEKQFHDQALTFRKQNYVGRFTYIFDNRYSVEGNFGLTGSENFSKGNRFGFFPAVGVAWVLSNEPYYNSSLKYWLSEAKLRFSVGRTGNDNLGEGARFVYRGTFNTAAGGYPLGIGGSGSQNAIAGLIEGRFESPGLTWEIEDKLNYGVDLGFLKDRVKLQLNYFDNNRYSILLQRRTVSASTGFRQAPYQNYGKVNNKGFDGGLTSNFKIGQVGIAARANYTFARNKILEYDEVPQVYPWMNITGTRLNSQNLYTAEGLYSINDFNVTETDGIKTYQLKEGLPQSALGAGIKPGDIRYKDLNGDGIINQFDQERDKVSPSIPEVMYGFGLNVDYKGFYANVFFQGAGKVSTVLGAQNPNGFFPFASGVDESSVRTEGLNRWTEENPSENVLFPRLRTTDFQHNRVASTWWLRDASFLRLKNIEIGYQIPKSVMEKWKARAARIYIMGYNIHSWDKIKMWDPEMGNLNAGMAYPLPRTFTFGLELTF